ncbi:hypothetical protein [Secundilactobacillus collinoides]|uniref:hypothetical protein n=1 Tax=Secundilactobacillus collinoides TaxID=33960 RepID=UPI000A496EF9|nr:hypothetical protein [Secundilactobacillus collinoides]
MTKISIELKHVSKRYQPASSLFKRKTSSPLVLKDINLMIPTGEFHVPRPKRLRKIYIVKYHCWFPAENGRRSFSERQ